MSGSTEVELFMQIAHKDSEKALQHLTNFVTSGKSDEGGDGNKKKKEDVIMELGSILAERKQVNALQAMIEKTRPFLVSLGKAKAAKMVRNLVDLFLDMEPAEEAQRSQLKEIKVTLVKECIQWSRDQKRVFLRQTLEARLVRLFNDIQRHQEALAIAVGLVKELKKLDDKDLIVEVQLEESKACYHLSNLTKARAALTSARTTANGIYIAPRMQAALDLQSGILHAADERDFKTAFSYFYEAFEGYDSVEQSREALRALKYMLLSKIMLDTPEEVQGILSGKLGLKYEGEDVEAMRAVAGAAKKRSLAHFNKAFGKYQRSLQMDVVVKSHFQSLSDSMMEKNLSRIIQPYSHVHIQHVAAKIGLPLHTVEKKLSQMILDGKICGILYQGEGILHILERRKADEAYETSLSTIHSLGGVLDALYQRANNIHK